MSEEATETTEATDTDDKPGTGEEKDWKAEADKWKALSRKHEQQAKSNADAAKRLKDAEDADKSETERLNERASAAEKKAEEAERRAWRLEVAADKGLTPTQAKRLQGSTREELEADADELRKDLGLDKSDTDEGDERRRPKEKLLPGASSEDDQLDDPDKLAEAVLNKKRGL